MSDASDGGTDGGRAMKDILAIRRILADIYYLRNSAVTAVDERDQTTLANELKEMKRKIATLEAMMEGAEQ